MPIYEYRCQNCGHQKEAIQKMSDAPLTECPACGEHALSKLISAPAFRLSGSGWYETDFKSDKEKKRNLASSSDTPSAAGGNTQKQGSSSASTPASSSTTSAE